VRRILVLGRAGWESKFIVRALEEEGWIVDLRLRVAPKHDVVQGHESAIDTAHYAAVIAVDTSVRALAGQLAAYVRSGGGLVTLAGYGGGTRADTVVLERQGLGRVAQVGYHDTWRWRMADADSGPARHRAWWSGVVASVSYAPSTTRLVATADADPAPLANLIDALGPPASPMAAVAPRRPPIDPTRQPWVFGAVLATLSLEWASRRLRGRH
jgi:hypothetical protein